MRHTGSAAEVGNTVHMKFGVVRNMRELLNNPFSKIYSDHTWKGRSLSGPGSDAERTVKFRRLLEEFIRQRNIRSVVDLGCGDWSYSQLVDWGQAGYTGLDVVPTVIDQNIKQYARAGVSFLLADPTDPALPAGDLLIVKEVLQHLPIDDINSILGKLNSYRYAILVNDVSHQIRGTWKNIWRWQSICSTNTDIERGGYRLLALRDPPFSLPAEHLLSYQNQYLNRRWIKEVVLWTRPSNC